MRAVLAQQYTRPYFTRNTPGAPSTWREQLLAAGRLETGKPYSGPIVGEPELARWGNPGWDCSSFVAGMAAQVLGDATTAYTDAAYDETLATDDPLPGDVVFYRYADASQPGVRFPHMGFWLSETHTLDCRYPMGVGEHPHVAGVSREVRTLWPYVPIGGFRARQVAEALTNPAYPQYPTLPRHVLASWPYLYAALTDFDIADRPVCIAALATMRVEVYYTLEPVREGITVANAEADYGYQTARGQSLGNTAPGDGYRYRGGGWIQLTGKGGGAVPRGYVRLQQVTGEPVVDDPDLILQPELAAVAMALYFVDSGIPDQARAGNWTEVRRRVNGGTNGLADFLGYVQRLSALPS